MTTRVKLLVLSACWGSTFMWIDLALDEGMSPWHVTWGRAAVASLVLLAAAPPRPAQWAGNGPRLLDLLIAALLCNAGPFPLFSLGQQTVPSGVAGVLNATTPIWTLMITAGLVPGTLGLRRVAGISIGFAGVVLLVEPWSSDLRPTVGVPLILLAAVGYAGGFVFMTRRLLPTAASPGELAGLQMSAATVLLMVPALLAGAPSRISPAGGGAVIVLGLVCTALTFAVVYRMLADDGATRTSVVGYLIPLVAVALGVALRAEPLRWNSLAGAVVVLTGVALTRAKPAARGGTLVHHAPEPEGH